MSKIPKLFNNGSKINRNFLNSSIIDTFQLQIQSQKSRFVTDVKYLQKTNFSILSPQSTDLVQYDQSSGLYNINISSSALSMPNYTTLDNIIELYNISRNESYMILQISSDTQKFMQPNEYVDIVKDVETSIYRITGYTSKENVNNNIRYIISSMYTYQQWNSFYILKYIGNKEFSIYECELSQNNTLESLDTIIRLLQTYPEDQILMDNPLLAGINKKDNIIMDVDFLYTFDDVTFSCQYNNEQIDSLQYLNYGDILYFYVNRQPNYQHNHDTRYFLSNNSIYNTQYDNIIEQGVQTINLNSGNVQYLEITEDTQIDFSFESNRNYTIKLIVKQGQSGPYTTSIGFDVLYEQQTPILFTQQQNQIDILDIVVYNGVVYININNNYQ